MGRTNLKRSKEEQQRYSATTARNKSFGVLKELYPAEWKTLYRKYKDRDEARKVFRSNHLDEYQTIYTQQKQLLEGTTIQTTTPSNIIITRVNNQAQSDFYKAGYTLLAKDPMPSPNGGFFTRMSKLLFVNDLDGTSLEAVGCNDCLSLFKNLQGTAHHIGRTHNGKTGKHKPVKKRVSKQKPIETVTTAVTTRPIMSAGIDPVKAITELVTQRNYWEAQAKAYEAQLNAIRQAFSGK